MPEPSCMVTLTGPGTSADLIRSPSALEMPSVGIVMVGSSPAMPKGTAAQRCSR